MRLAHCPAHSIGRPGVSTSINNNINVRPAAFFMVTAPRILENFKIRETINYYAYENELETYLAGRQCVGPGPGFDFRDGGGTRGRDVRASANLYRHRHG